MKFSIVIPTQDRVKWVDIVLSSLEKQTYGDFEVIITDDYRKESCEDIVKKFRDNRFIYVSPPREANFGMCQNWEFGLNHAQGSYIIFIQDKMYLYYDSLEKLANYIDNHSSVDVISWNWDYYVFKDEEKSLQGELNYKLHNNNFSKQNIIEIVSERISFLNYTYQNDEGGPGIGSPLCSAIKKDIYKKITMEYGLVFDFINPDYGPPIRILDFARDVVYCHDNLAVLMTLSNSEGTRHSISYECAERFLMRSPCGEKRMLYATIPDLKVTDSNMVSADYNFSLINSNNFKELGECNKLNVIVSIARNIEKMKTYPSEQKKEEVYKIISSAIDSLSCNEKKVFAMQKKIVDKKSVYLREIISNMYNKILSSARIKNYIQKIRGLNYARSFFENPVDTFSIRLK